MEQINPGQEQPAVLVVDDEEAILEMLKTIFAREGYRVIITSDSRKVLKLTREYSPDIILLDIMLPFLDGFDVCRLLKNDLLLKEIPVIFLTVKSEKEDIVKGIEAGAVDYITKPFSVTELLARVKTHIELKKSKDQLQKMNDDILTSIRYARKIQNSILPDHNTLESFFSSYFILWRPRDIVGGDFYWFQPRKDNFLLILGDCTGHGVPGAFMTMIANSTLTRIAADYCNNDPAQILHHLNVIIRSTLHQTQNTLSSDDGMDIAVVYGNLTEKKVIFASARLSLFITRGSQAIFEIPGNRRSIGYSSSNEEYEFTNHEIVLKGNERFYLVSDGFTDQLGGENDLPMGKKGFRNYLRSCREDSLESQKIFLKERFLQYKGNNSQIDDVTVLGFTLKNNSPE